MEKKLKSRKFWACAAGFGFGVITAAGGMVCGDMEQLSLGAKVMTASILGYFCAEGFADGMGALANRSIETITTTVNAHTSDERIVDKVVGTAGEGNAQEAK